MTSALLRHKPLTGRVPRKIKRLSGRSAVTIVAGFKCADGVVLCADTQETLEGTKTYVPKLRMFPILFLVKMTTPTIW
jgi:hypothetical protein